MTDLRIGQGIDVHRFGPGDAVTLGGISIPCDAGLMAHSDGDVVLHAICDALLGSLALGDIGHHFPDTDPRYAGIDSRRLLHEVGALIRAQGFAPVNLDITVVAQKPKLAPHIDAMCEAIAAALGLERGRVSVKATTSEGLGFTGRGEGIAAYATVLVEGV